MSPSSAGGFGFSIFRGHYKVKRKYSICLTKSHDVNPPSISK